MARFHNGTAPARNPVTQMCSQRITGAPTL
jgi:hypothetical protein